VRERVDRLRSRALQVGGAARAADAVLAYAGL